MDACLAGILHRRVVPTLNHLMTLPRAEQGQPAHRLRIVLYHPFQQSAELSQIALDRRLLEQRGGVLQTSSDALTGFLEGKRQIELRHHRWKERESSYLQAREL